MVETDADHEAVVSKSPGPDRGAGPDPNDGGPGPDAAATAGTPAAPPSAASPPAGGPAAAAGSGPAATAPRRVVLAYDPVPLANDDDSRDAMRTRRGLGTPARPYGTAASPGRVSAGSQAPASSGQSSEGSMASRPDAQTCQTPRSQLKAKASPAGHGIPAASPGRGHVVRQHGQHDPGVPPAQPTRAWHLGTPGATLRLLPAPAGISAASPPGLRPVAAAQPSRALPIPPWRLAPGPGPLGATRCRGAMAPSDRLDLV